MLAGDLDYGQILQIAAKHDKYRYDDVDRFSTMPARAEVLGREQVKVYAQACHSRRQKANLVRISSTLVA